MQSVINPVNLYQHKLFRLYILGESTPDLTTRPWVEKSLFGQEPAAAENTENDTTTEKKEEDKDEKKEEKKEEKPKKKNKEPKKDK